MILYNGATGSLGRYFASEAPSAAALKSRLEDRAGTRDELRAVLSGARGQGVTLVQMAAMVSVPACERDPAAAERTNVTEAVSTVCDFIAAARSVGASPRILYVSTGHVYGAQPPGVRIAEDAPLAPRSVYARTKLAAERELARAAGEAAAPLVVARVFGLIAPTQPPHYVLPALIRRVCDRQLVGVPGLACVRDYLDARDVCRLLSRLCDDALASSLPAVVNVCSGTGVTIRSLLEEILRVAEPASFGERAKELTEAPGRADDVPSIVGDPSRLEALLGEPLRRIPLAQTVSEAWRLQGSRTTS
jgi:nucleoside-diphosphate-sugar epimerase